MASLSDFSASPYAVLVSEHPWFPADEVLRVKTPLDCAYIFLDAKFATMAGDRERWQSDLGDKPRHRREGLDYASPAEKYKLRALPDRKFSGLHLMCLMFAGFKRITPETDNGGLDLEEPFLTALELFNERQTKF